MKPLIKWPGGKTSELSIIQRWIFPKFDRYIEPFVGGGALFFALEHNRNLINDVDENLTLFYQNVKTKNHAFFQTLDAISNDWNKIKNLVPLIEKPFRELKDQILRSLHQEDHVDADKDIKGLLEQQVFNLEFMDIDNYKRYLHKSLVSKLNRIAKLEFKKNGALTGKWKYQDHLENAIRSAYYTMLRDEHFEETAVANAVFYFIREFCYGAMFRFNKEGKFNIPYGGNAYNRKSLQQKIDRLKTTTTQKLLQNTEIFNLDFRKFIGEVQPTENDFVFFDPPYDSNFKDYGQNSFTRKDHHELAELFATLPSKNLMIIGGSDFIKKIYSEVKDDINPEIQILDYEKTYSYNVRGRNNRKTKHLLITNYSLANLDQRIQQQLELFT